ncbi:hypothetical protein HA402_003943 [Bradysia odoriphaga]|nr:hypothetical protein HA402_003943 [Bradysia odoriphaga]
MLYIGDYEEFKSRLGDERFITCTVCSSENSLKKMNGGNFYIELPIRDQLVKKIYEHDVLNYDTTPNSSCITDIFDGELYKSLRRKIGKGPLVTLTLNTDGVRVFKSKRKASLWPIQMFINEVSPVKRLKTDNIILSGIWFGKDPIFELYFKPLTKELNDLEENKIAILLNNVPNFVTVRVLLISADLPAKSKLMKMKQFNGKFGCTYCHHPGFRVDESVTRKYILSSEEHDLRTHESTIALIKSYIETGKECFGVTGVSPVIGFKDYDLIRGTVIDYLHCILEGVTDLLTDLWFDSTNHREPYYIIPRLQELAGSNLKAITPLRTFSIKPRPIADRHW